MIMLGITANAQEKKKWNFEMGVGMSQNSGNVDNFSLKNSSELQRNDSIITANVNYKFVYQKEDGKETNKGINTGIKFDWYQYNRWSPFIAMETVSNKYKGYDLKVSGLVGVKLRIWTKPDTCDYSISTAIVYDNVDYTPEENELNNEVWRLSIRPKIKQKFGENVSLLHYTFYQPSLKEFDDYLISSTTKLVTKITTKLSLEIGYNYEYRSKLPTEDYKHYDMTTDVTLKLKF